MTAVRQTVLAVTAALGCGQPSELAPGTEIWVTEPDYEIGNAFGGPAAFALVSDVRVSPDGERVFVLEPYLARVSVWRPRGDLVLDMEKPGEGPGEFQTPHSVAPGPAGFLVQDDRRFTFFAQDGTVLRTVPNPPAVLSFQGFQLLPRLLTDSDGYLVVPAIPGSVAAAWAGDDPFEELPVFHVWPRGDRWAMDTIALLDTQNRDLAVRPTGSEWEFTWQFHTGQPLADDDLTYFDPQSGNLVIARRNLGNGVIELLEITPLGDTIWHRRFAVEPMSLPADLLEGAIDVLADQVVNQSAMTGQRVSGAEARALVEDALYAPDPLPSVRDLRGMSTGELWMQTFEEVDTLAVLRGLASRAASSAQRMGRSVPEATAQRLAEEALYVPEYLPAVAEARVTASDELWLLSPEESDARRVWYAARRHDDVAEPRRVLLPEWFQLRDVTTTHVWGLRLDEESGVRVVGRRLVEGAEQLRY